MFSIIILAFLLGSICASKSQTQEKGINLIEIQTFEQCDGKDASNYTKVNPYSLDSTCNPPSNNGPVAHYLISCSNNGNKTVNNLVTLSVSEYPAGAYKQYEELYLVESGNLQGKYVYLKNIFTSESYLKRCSSVLGYSYVSPKSLVLLIAEKLDLNIFLSPSGAYEAFKKSASTICQGNAKIF